MSSGGQRENAGRKKIGIIVNTRIDEQLIMDIDQYISGTSRAEKIRNCLTLGIENKKNKPIESKESSNAITINKFYKVYNKLLSMFYTDEPTSVKILNAYMLDRFTSTLPSYREININELIHKEIANEFSKFSWSINENDSRNNLITPSIIGSVLEREVNKRETGSYYTPKDTTTYIAQYSIVFAIIRKCNLESLNNYFYGQSQDYSDVTILNDDSNPVQKLINAINKLSDDDKKKVFDAILKITILDPTCGTGSFIIVAAEILVEIYKQTNMYLYISLQDYVVNMFNKCLFGVDIIDTAITLLHLRCKLYMYNLGINKVTVESINFRFYCGDSLTSINCNNLGDKSFNWRKCFHEVIDEGFDCIIGNPPYVEKSKEDLDLETFGNYATDKCGNLYAYIFENSLRLLKENSYMGMIVPISVTSTHRMEPLRQVLFDSCEYIYIANFSDRPSCLFTGVHQKLSIVFAKKTKPVNGCKIYTTSYIHWNKKERNTLFQKIRFCRTMRNLVTDNYIAKVGDDIKLSILKKVIDCPYKFSHFLSTEKNENVVYLNQRMTFWAKCFTQPEKSNEYKTYYIRSDISNKAIAALINSSLFYMLWETYSDCWHVTRSDLDNLCFNDNFLSANIQQKLKELEIKLEEKLYETREYIYSKQTDYIYVHRLCNNEITNINDLVAEIYNFTECEKEYIQNYNIDYRLSSSNNAEEK